MPWRDLYKILGVPTRAAPGAIRRAYRQIALAVHPDVGAPPDPERFREVREAYEVLSDPERRRAYDVKFVTRAQPLSVEPLRCKAPVTVLDDFFTVRPSIDEVLAHPRQNFFGHRPKSGGPYRRLGIEVILEPDEVRFGCRLPFNIPCYITCERCGGSAEWWGLCSACYGGGMVEGTKRVMLEIPPGARDGERYEIDLAEVGIGNLLLDVRLIAP
jgi:DnaJ-class molecular chaperone